MNLNLFSISNRERCESPEGFNHKLESWSLSDWMVATTGEVGEAANVIKKLNRDRDGVPGNTRAHGALLLDLADEIGDSAIYLDLLAQRAGLSLSNCIYTKFNVTSQARRFPRILGPDGKFI